uniref:C-type lectin domain-containing protein n=1 Tax=Oryzias melastigma TaxID=30732 RepID=A0A3B3B8V3_ORYME
MLKKVLLLVTNVFLTDIFILSSCLLIRQYHYIDNPLTWTEAQTYCRQNYIDLAIIESPEEQEKFLKSTTSSSYKAFWIGLHNEINWKWSDGFIGGITTDNYWTSQDQYHSRTDQICLTTSRTNRLSDFDCGLLLTFICYKEYIFVNETMNWFSAQRYCRQNFTDLATVWNNKDWEMIYSVASDTMNSWIGLYRDSNISWSDGNSFSPNKTGFPLLLWPNNARCGSYYIVKEVWSFEPCTFKRPFVCYSFKPGDFKITSFKWNS